MKACDNKSVGILTWRTGGLLLIQRRRPPFGLAPPAGHVDDHGGFAAAAKQELFEETGLKVRTLELIASGRKSNRCRRPGGSWHDWRIFVACSTGQLQLSSSETQGAVFLTKSATAQLLVTGHELEPVWREWFVEIDLIGRFEELATKAGYP